jgi:hypothetical protein
VRLWFNRVSGCPPGAEATLDGSGIGEAAVQQEERRTGAGLFGWSGAVSDDPIIRTELVLADRDLIQGDGQRTGDMGLLIGARVAHVHEHRSALVERPARILEANPLDRWERHFTERIGPGHRRGWLPEVYNDQPGRGNEHKARYY